MLLVTEGVTVTEWFVTVPFEAVGVPADPVVTALTFIAPSVYLLAATAVCAVVVGVIVVPLTVVSCDVLDPDTVMVPDVPLDTHPVETVGVTLLEEDAVAVIKPLAVFTVMVGFAVIVVAGVETLPVDTAPIVTSTSSSPSYPASAVTVSVCCDVVGVYETGFV